jgi:hypothetical protein
MGSLLLRVPEAGLAENRPAGQADLPATLWAIAAIVVLAMCGALLWHAATTNFWDDEVMGYFLCRAPFAETISLMANNLHHDPPLFEVVQQPWVQFVGPNAFLLRLPSFIYWVLAVWGIFAATRRLAGDRAGLLAVITAAVMPLHWIFPISMRWYSLTACLAVWNFAAFLSLRAAADRNTIGGFRQIAGDKRFWAYTVSGIALWYAQYIAPVFFFAHLLICLIWSRNWRRIAVWLCVAWSLIGLAYLPWLPTFFRQLSISRNLSSPILYLSSWWTLWCGDLVHPLQWWATLAFGVSGVMAAVFIVKYWRVTGPPGLIFLTVAAALTLSGNMLTKRVMLLSPFLAIGLGVALALLWQERGKSWQVARWTFMAAATSAIAGSIVGMIQREHWASYRWLDPFEQIVADIRERHDDPLVMTNSISVLFYMGDDFGFHGAQGIRDTTEHPYVPKAFEYPFTAIVKSAFDERVRSASEVFVIHHNAVAAYSHWAENLNSQLEEYGFGRVSEEGILPVTALYRRLHARSHTRSPSAEGPFDGFRVVVARFVRENPMPTD